MAFDFKKEYKEFYLPKGEPALVTVPPMRFLAVRGQGDPNDPGGAYQAAISILYALAFTIKMSKLGDRRIDGYFDYVVPPLEGFWRQEGVDGVEYARKADFQWLSVLRVPDFVGEGDFQWAVETASAKKGLDCSPARLVTIHEGLCVQCLHTGPYDGESAAVARMDAFLAENGYENDFSGIRRHHEIYLSDPRRIPPEKRRTVIRHPVRRAAG